MLNSGRVLGEMSRVAGSESRKHHNAAGISLAEVIIGLCLFAVAIIPIFGIIPTAYMSIKKAEDYSAASFYAQQVTEIYRISDPSLEDDFHNEWDLDLNNQGFRVVLDLYGADRQRPHALVDVIVNLYWKNIPEHVNVYTRVYYR